MAQTRSKGFVEAHDEGPECGLRQDFVLATVSVAVSLGAKPAKAEEGVLNCTQT